MNTPAVTGIHHVTAITADAQKNIDFYTGVLGLRLVKLTVNFDDPSSYHLYYGDELGRPGTIMTFFVWPGIARGRIGPPQVSAAAFAIPSTATQFWVDRLRERGAEGVEQSERFGERVITILDPDGMQIDLIGVKRVAGDPWAKSDVPQEHAIRGFASVTISEEGYERTADLLTSVMGFFEEASEGNRFRYRARTESPENFASTINLLCVPDARHGLMGGGIVHHIAFRTPDDAQQKQWREIVADAGFNVSPVMDRKYFHSIYFREPGGVLFEIATDAPGFTVDEPAELLGSSLMLPPQYEAHRDAIVQMLPKVKLPAEPA